MGQYYKIVNIDKKQYINPHDFDDGAKLLEFGISSFGTMSALALLLADGNNRGGGDLRSDNPIIGSWAGNRVVVAGDYADPKKHLDDKETEKLFNVVVQDNPAYAEENCNLYNMASKFYTNISQEAIEAMAEDEQLKSELQRREVLTDETKSDDV